MEHSQKKPIFKINVGSGITASIWENQTDNGVLHAVEVERRYRVGEEWKTSTSYVGSQILMVAKAYELAFQYIAGQKSQN